jgi:carbon-monoxide dehydrogenase small subunit
MVMSAIELVKDNPNPSEAEIREGLEGNICRCTGYHNIVKSVQAGAEMMGESACLKEASKTVSAPLFGARKT